MNRLFNCFNSMFTKIINEFKPLYAIAFYEMDVFKGLTGIVGDNYEEIKKLYDEKYTWKAGQIGVTEYHYKIVKIEMNEVQQ